MRGVLLKDSPRFYIVMLIKLICLFFKKQIFIVHLLINWQYTVIMI